MVLVFTDVIKAQVFKKPYTDSPHHETKIPMSFNYLILFKPIEHRENYSNRGPNDKMFLFENEGRKYVYVGENFFSFETTDKIVEYSSNHGLNVVKYSYAHGIENMKFRLCRKFIPFEEYKISTQKDD